MSFRRSALGWLLGSLLALVAVGAVGAGALVLWLRSEAGRRWVGRAIAERVEQVIDGRLSFDRVDGPHIHGIRLEGVVLRDGSGRVVGTARSVTAHWTPAGLLVRRLDRLVGDGPVLTVELLVVREVAPEHPPQPARPITVREIAVREGVLNLYGTTVSSVEGSARLELGERSTLRITDVDARFGSHPLRGSGEVHWADDQPIEVRGRATADDGALVAQALVRQAPEAGLQAPQAWLQAPQVWLIEDAVLRGGSSQVAGHGWWSPGSIGVVVDEGVLQPGLLERFVPPLATGQAVRFRGQAQGPLSQLAVTLRTTGLAPLPVAVRGRIDVPRRAGVLAVSAGASKLRASGRVTPRAVDLRLRARLVLADARRLGIPADAPVEVQVVARGAPLTPTIQARVAAPGALSARLTATVDLPARRARTALIIDELHRGTSTLRGLRVAAAMVARGDVIALDDLHLHWDGMPRGYRDAAGAVRITRADRALSSRLWLSTPLGPLRLDGTLVLQSGAAELRDLRASLGASRLRGALRVVDGRFNATIEELVIQPALVRRVRPELAPTWPFEVDGAATGTTRAVELTLRVSAGPSTARITGTVDPRGRRLQLVGEVDAFDPDVVRPTQTEARIHFEFFADLRQAGEGLLGVAQVRDARGNVGEASFMRGRLEASFHGRDFEVSRARVNSPALRLSGRGRGTIDGSLHLGYNVLVTDTFHLRQIPPTLRGFLGVQQIIPGRVVEGAIDKRSGQPFVFSHHYLPPGLRFVHLLFGMGRDN